MASLLSLILLVLFLFFFLTTAITSGGDSKLPPFPPSPTFTGSSTRSLGPAVPPIDAFVALAVTRMPGCSTSSFLELAEVLGASFSSAQGTASSSRSPDQLNAILLLSPSSSHTVFFVSNTDEKEEEEKKKTPLTREERKHKRRRRRRRKKRSKEEGRLGGGRTEGPTVLRPDELRVPSLRWMVLRFCQMKLVEQRFQHVLVALP